METQFNYYLLINKDVLSWRCSHSQEVILGKNHWDDRGERRVNATRWGAEQRVKTTREVNANKNIYFFI